MHLCENQGWHCIEIASHRALFRTTKLHRNIASRFRKLMHSLLHRKKSKKSAIFAIILRFLCIIVTPSNSNDLSLHYAAVYKYLHSVQHLTAV